MMNYPIRIGIVGGGQLGRMLTQSAKKLGFYVTVIDPTPLSPAGQVADKQIIGGYKDEKTTRLLSKDSDVITIDAEFVNDKVLEEIERSGKPVHPNPKTISIIKDKLKQKIFLQKNKIPTAKFIPIKNRQEIIRALKKFGYPLLLKARFDAYDGKGNFVIKNKKEIDLGLEKLKGRNLYIEKYVNFTKELAVMVAKDINGKIKVYPTVQTFHKDNICDMVVAPAPVSKKLFINAQSIAKKIVKNLEGAGVFGVELFLTKNDKIIVNEIAPRVHNSGHYTIEASVTSQFEQHIRAITGLPLGDTSLICKAAVMKNILGEIKNGNGFPKGIEKALAIPGVSLHIYGKKESRIQRKMGHITVIGNNIEECLKKANRARKAIII